MYCVAMRRDVHEMVGPLDEAYGIGLFEDDDYSMRVRGHGFRVACAEDAYVHHVGQVTFSSLAGRTMTTSGDAIRRTSNTSSE